MIDDPVLLNDWHVVGRASELNVGSVRAVRLLEHDLVLWRSDAGVRVWRDLCLHRGTKLSGGRVESACLTCPYHGWQYDESGQCVKIPAQPDQPPPARARVTSYRVEEKYGMVWVCLGTPANPVPGFAEWDDARFRKIAAGPYLFRAHAPRVIENFLDVGHFPFVHAGLLGDPAHTRIADYEVETAGEGIVAKDIAVWQPDPDGTQSAAEVKYTYKVLRPLSAYFLKTHREQRFAIFNCVTPVAARESLSWMILALDYAHEAPEEELRTFQDRIAGQDVPIVESQRPELLPLDLQAELHLKSDRTAIAYRKWLAKLGLKYGAA